MKGFASLPINLPGTTLSKAYSGRDKMLALIEKSIQDHKKLPSSEKDAVFYLLQEQEKPDSNLTDEMIAYEMLHFMIASMAPMYTLHTYLLFQLSQNLEMLKQVTKEVQTHCPEGPITLEGISKMHYTMQVIHEVKRFYAGYAVPLSWGKVANPICHQGKLVPKGWGVIGSFYSVSHSPTMFSDPEKFDPERFSETRAEHKKHPHAFVPQGIIENVEKTHGCAGYHYSNILLKVFLVHLLRGEKYSWSLLPKQKFERDPAAIPGVPIDGLKVEFALR